MDNTFLQLESAILGLQALCFSHKTLVRNRLPPDRGTDGALPPLHSGSCWTGWPGTGIFHTVTPSLVPGSGTHFAGDTKDRPGLTSSKQVPVFDIVGTLTVRQALD